MLVAVRKFHTTKLSPLGRETEVPVEEKGPIEQDGNGMSVNGRPLSKTKNRSMEQMKNALFRTSSKEDGQLFSNLSHEHVSQNTPDTSAIGGGRPVKKHHREKYLPPISSSEEYSRDASFGGDEQVVKQHRLQRHLAPLLPPSLPDIIVREDEQSAKQHQHEKYLPPILSPEASTQPANPLLDIFAKGDKTDSPPEESLQPDNPQTDKTAVDDEQQDQYEKYLPPMIPPDHIKPVSRPPTPISRVDDASKWLPPSTIAETSSRGLGKLHDQMKPDQQEKVRLPAETKRSASGSEQLHDVPKLDLHDTNVSTNRRQKKVAKNPKISIQYDDEALQQVPGSSSDPIMKQVKKKKRKKKKL